MVVKSLMPCANTHGDFTNHGAFDCAKPLVKYAKRRRIRLKRIDFTTAREQLLSDVTNIGAAIYGNITRFQITERRSESVQRVFYFGQNVHSVHLHIPHP